MTGSRTKPRSTFCVRDVVAEVVDLGIVQYARARKIRFGNNAFRAAFDQPANDRVDVLRLWCE